MMSGAAARRAQELADAGAAFVTATVVRAQHPTSVQAGNVALVLSDGTIDGFIGGVCAEHSVRLYSLRALASGEAVLLRILPDAGEGGSFEHDPPAGDEGAAGREVAHASGAVTVQNPCLSGGAIEVFLEPVLPAPRVLVVGETPIAQSLLQLGAEVGLDLIAVEQGTPEPARGDLALIVAAHGRDELDILRRGLESGLPYVGLVASHKRGSALVEELRAEGVADRALALLDTPAGFDIGARTPAEIALAILARIVAVRRGSPAQAVPLVAAPLVAVDPICGMSVVADLGTPSVAYDGHVAYFCCEGCKAKFEAQHAHANAAE